MELIVQTELDGSGGVAARAETGRRAALEAFLRNVEKRAYRIARVTIADADEALDVVQDAMIRLAHRYADRPAEELRPLFYRILKNRIRDWHRRSALRRRIFGWWPAAGAADGADDEPPDAPDPAPSDPFERLADGAAMEALEAALRALPVRQREAFMLRTFEGLDVAGTALTMGCSDGSVKTHYSRAVSRLRELLGEHR